MSVITNRSGAPRATAPVCSAIMSTVAGIVESWPCITMATLSPTSTASMSAPFRMRADQWS
jgi:hypothetical protein